MNCIYKKIYTLMFCIVSVEILWTQQDFEPKQINENIIEKFSTEQPDWESMRLLFLKEIISLINDSSLQIDDLTTPICMSMRKHYDGSMQQEIQEWINSNYSFYPWMKNSELSIFKGPIKETDKFSCSSFNYNGYAFMHTIHAKNSTKPKTLLGLAVSKKNKMLAAYLIRLGANINDYYFDYQYPLHDAVSNSDFEMFLLLLSLGANYNIQDGIGSTPLYRAIKSNENDIVQLLLAHGADPNIADREGYSPLHIVVFGDNLKSDQHDRCNVINQLLDAGAHINAQNRYGQTPLMTAAFFNYIDETKLLIAKGACTNIADNNGITVFDMPLKEQMKNIIINKDDKSTCVVS